MYVYDFLGLLLNKKDSYCPQHTPHLLPPSQTSPSPSHPHQPSVIFLQVSRVGNVKLDTITQSPWHPLFIC